MISSNVVAWRIAGLDYISHYEGSFGSWLIVLYNQVSISYFSRVVMLCWAIWNMHNELIWRGKISTMNYVIISGRVILDQWLRVQENNYCSSCGSKGWC